MKQLALLITILSLSLQSIAQDKSSKIEDFITEGIKLHDQKKYDEAISSYKEALKLDAGNATANYELAFSLMSKGATKEAIPYLENVTKTKSSVNVNAFDMLGSIYDDMDQKEKAIDYFKKGIEANPSYQRIYYNIALTYVRMGKEKEAASYLVEALKRDPNHASSHRLYARLMFQNPATKVDAVLAFCNFLILEPTSKRSADAFKDLNTLLGSGVAQTDKGNNISIGSGTDTERNAANLTISMSGLTSGLVPGLSETDKLAEQLKMIFSTVAELSEKKTQKDFFWSYYGDYFGKISKTEYMPMIAHIVGFTANEKENQKWINDNQVQFVNFGKWEESNSRKLN
ncbi:MAG: tetratricopeptide repeat protein [Sphingobacteriales bacterium]|nr:MAG: tetratricopeptide repeat protein [Sphingobacteriales bacterium]